MRCRKCGRDLVVRDPLGDDLCNLCAKALDRSDEDADYEQDLADDDPPPRSEPREGW